MSKHGKTHRLRSRKCQGDNQHESSISSSGKTHKLRGRKWMSGWIKHVKMQKDTQAKSQKVPKQWSVWIAHFKRRENTQAETQKLEKLCSAWIKHFKSVKTHILRGWKYQINSQHKLINSRGQKPYFLRVRKCKSSCQKNGTLQEVGGHTSWLAESAKTVRWITHSKRSKDTHPEWQELEKLCSAWINQEVWRRTGWGEESAQGMISMNWAHPKVIRHTNWEVQSAKAMISMNQVFQEVGMLTDWWAESPRAAVRLNQAHQNMGRQTGWEAGTVGCILTLPSFTALVFLCVRSTSLALLELGLGFPELFGNPMWGPVKEASSYTWQSTWIEQFKQRETHRLRGTKWGSNGQHEAKTSRGEKTYKLRDRRCQSDSQHGQVPQAVG